MEKTMEIGALINNAIADLTGDNELAATLTPDMDLFNDVGLDSIQMVSMILTLEDDLDLVIEFEEFDFEGITTIRQLSEYLQDLKENAS